MAWVNGEWVSDYGNVFSNVNIDGTGGLLSPAVTTADVNAASYTGYKPIAPTATDINTNTGTSMFEGVDMAGLGGLAQGVGALGSAYVGYKGLGLAEDQFGFEKALANRNLENQGITINNAYRNANEVGLALAGDTMTQAQRDASIADTQSRFVTGGIRIGTAAVTTRGLKEKEMAQVGEWINRAIENTANLEVLSQIRLEVRLLCDQFALYPELRDI